MLKSIAFTRNDSLWKYLNDSRAKSTHSDEIDGNYNRIDFIEYRFIPHVIKFDAIGFGFDTNMYKYFRLKTFNKYIRQYCVQNLN